ncbi:hypothetical protein [Legionella impletisoli]|uniref:Transmembrane protein n=1 Tax=Legionella impletisoli TaxID=343510 RepID=A0A917JSX4_9GAMM|nr:hypothetical protein [Legionella impletisoli]GGI84890.1 hypothetical protein GCM10007966_11810 [Legionella impletisoli]
METLYQILGLIAAGVIIWILYRYIRARPETLSRESLSKSFFTMGILAILLMCFVALLIVMARST